MRAQAGIPRHTHSAPPPHVACDATSMPMLPWPCYMTHPANLIRPSTHVAPALLMVAPVS